MNTQHHGKPVAPTRATATCDKPSVAALAFELRQSGIAPQGLGFALRTLGSDRVLEELRTRARFGARCQRRGVVANDPDERAAWTILAASGPWAIERRLERDGLMNRRRYRPRADRPSRHGTDATVLLLRGRAEFGDPAARTPFQEQLAEVALALAEAS